MTAADDTLPTTCPPGCAEPPGHGWAAPVGQGERSRICRTVLTDVQGFEVALYRFQIADADGNVTVTPEVRLDGMYAVSPQELLDLAPVLTDAARLLAAEQAAAATPGGQAPPRPPCPPWCSTPAHRTETTWDRNDDARGAAATCTHLVGVARVDSTPGMGVSEWEIGLERYVSWDNRTGLEITPSVVTIDDDLHPTANEARKLAELLHLAADLSDGRVNSGPAGDVREAEKSSPCA